MSAVDKFWAAMCEVPDWDSDYNRIHRQRYFNSFEFIEPYFTGLGRLLEIGNSSLFTGVLQRMFPTLKIEHTTHDLRYGDTEHPAESYDWIFNMEVMEHVKDKNPEHDLNLTQWSGSGIKTMVDDCWRLLKPGGFLFLTTPNASSVDTLIRVLSYEPVFIYYPHVREYSINELRAIFQKRFTLVKLETRPAWLEFWGAGDNLRENHAEHYGQWIWNTAATTRQKVVEMLKLANLNTDLRDDDTLLLCRK